jgi:hypothetical protein
VTTTQLLNEKVVEGLRLGRHVHHDPQNLQYPFQAAPVGALASRRWSLDSDLILDQGNLGSCTGNATVGALICSNNNPLHDGLSDLDKGRLDEFLAVQVYSAATVLDPFPGTYKPDDTGSDGPDAAKAARNMGLISGYSHALSQAAVLTALQHGPVIIGIDWTEGFDSPDVDGKVYFSGQVRGGHEICLDEIDMDKQVVWFRNSWTDSWGNKGRAYFTFDDLTTLMGRQGDATVLVPVNRPAPQPQPVPPTPPAPPAPAPTPTPDPTPTPTPPAPANDEADKALFDAVSNSEWAAFEQEGAAEDVRQAFLTWVAAKHL